MVFKEGIPEPIDRPNMFKIKYEWGKKHFCIGRPPTNGIITGCPFGYPCDHYNIWDTVSVGSLKCMECQHFYSINKEQQYVICNRNITKEKVHRKNCSEYLLTYSHG